MRRLGIDVFTAFGIQRNGDGGRISEGPGFALGPASAGRKIVINHVLVQMLSDPAAGENLQFQLCQTYGDGGIDIRGNQPHIRTAFQHIIGGGDVIAGIEFPERRRFVRYAVGADPDDPDPVLYGGFPVQSCSFAKKSSRIYRESTLL